MGPPPLTWGVRLAGGCAKGPGTGAGGAGADGMDRPSNLGSWGAAATVSQSVGRSVGCWCRERRTLESKLGRGVAASLVVADQTQDLAEACRRQQASVLCVCDLPYLAQHGWLQLRPLEELDGDFACDDAELLRVGLLEEILEGALLVGGEVQAAFCAGRWLAPGSSQQQQHGTGRAGGKQEAYRGRRSPRGPP